MTAHDTDWAVVGGGILGLTLALRLAEHGHGVTVYERASEIGGLASSFRLGDVTWDRFYHVMLQSDTTLRSLLEDLGLEDDIRWATTGTGLYDRGRLFPVSSAADYLRLPVLGPTAKARIAATVLRASRTKDWQSLEKVTAEEWLSRWSGRSAYETFWLPLLRSKLGDRHDQASAAFIWAIMQRLYAARRAGMKQDLFGYVPGGYARILARFREVLLERGVVLKTSTGVRSVRAVGEQVEVYTDKGAGMFGNAVVTAPSLTAARLVPQLSDRERTAHESIIYQGIVCLSLLLDVPLGGYYVTNITDPAIPFTGVIEMTALVDPAEFGGQTLVYLPKYIAPGDVLFDTPDDVIESSFVDALFEMYPAARVAHIAASAVSRVQHVLPVATVGYSKRLPPMRTSVPGVYIVNTAHIVNGTLNVNETVQLADRVMPDLLAKPGSEQRQ
ncbi:MAG: NAD(P)/FAD-dependent oxidoreductase [Actinomycetota bacterium]|nr:NAD(P)/FAD-dependent oxidoreductase [Actinomycetota bacterium]